MPPSKKTKNELIAELKKLQEKVKLLENPEGLKKEKHKQPLLEESNLMSFLKHSKNYIVLVDRNGNIMDINKTEAGLIKEKVIGLNIRLFITPESLEETINALKNVFEKQEPQVYVTSRVNEKGELMHYSNTLTPIVENNFVVAAIMDSADITTEVKIQNELKESEEKFRILVQNATDVVYRYQVYPLRKLEYMSPSVEKISGYSPEEFYNDNQLGFKLIHPDDVHKVLELEKRYLNGEITKEEKLKENVYRWVKKDGSIIWAETLNTDIYDKNGNLIAVDGISRDITERKLFEQKLIESEKRYKDLIEGSTELVQSIDVEGNFLYVNQVWKDALGYNADEILKLKLYDIIDEEYLEQCKNEFKKALKGEVLKNIQVVFQTKVGNRLFLEGNIIPRFLNDEIIGSQAFFENVSDRKEMEALMKVKEQNTLLARHAELVPGLIFQYQVFPDGRFMFPFASTKIWDTFELTPEDVRLDASLAFNRVHIDDQENIVRSIRESMKTLNDWDQEFRVNLPVKGIRWLSGHAKPEKLADGSFIWHGYYYDVTERKIILEQINQSLQEKEVLLKEVHHRVKNNLQVISSILNLQSSYVKDEATVNVLRESQNRIKSMAFIHESLYQANDFSSINFSDYVVNLLQNLMQSYSKLNQTVKLNVDLQTIFLNLDSAIPCGLVINEIISNALKYAFVVNKEGDEITITMQMEEDKIRLVVGDNGIGLPPNIDYKNTESLGLQLVVTLVGQLNGSLDLDNTKGTKYTIVFPK